MLGRVYIITIGKTMGSSASDTTMPSFQRQLTWRQECSVGRSLVAWKNVKAKKDQNKYAVVTEMTVATAVTVVTVVLQ